MAHINQRAIGGSPDISANLRRMMRMRRMTVAELTERSGLSRATVGSAIAGRYDIRVSTLVAFRRALACSWEELLGP